MKSRCPLVVFLLLVLLAWLLPQTEAAFPVDLVRVVTTFPNTPTVDTPRMAWFLLAMAFKIVVLGFWLGLPTIPERRPIRQVHQDDDFLGSAVSQHLSIVMSYFDVMPNTASIILTDYITNRCEI